MIRKTVLASLVAATLLATGCAPSRVVVRGECSTNGECKVTGEATWELQRSGGGTEFKSGESFDAGELVVDVSDTTVPLDATSGTILVTAILADGSTAVNAFAWQRSGGLLSATQPAAINAWLANYDGQLVELETELQGIDVVQQNGSNTFAFDANYGGGAIGSGSSTWYHGGSGGIRPPTHEN